MFDPKVFATPPTPAPVGPKTLSPSGPTTSVPSGLNMPRAPQAAESSFLGDLGKVIFDNPFTQAALAPITAAGTLLSHIPLGGLGADQQFAKNGEVLKTTDPAAYNKWLTVKAAADADMFGGGNLRADFNREIADAADMQSKAGFVGKSLDTYMGAAGQGSLGGALSHALQGWFGLPAAHLQSFLGDVGFFDPGAAPGIAGIEKTLPAIMRRQNEGIDIGPDAKYAVAQFQAGIFTEAQATAYLKANASGGRNRLEESMARFDRGDTVSPVEQTAIEGVRQHGWTERHALDFIIRSGQSVSGDPLKQIVGGTVTDPLVIAGGLAGIGGKAVAIGRAIGESGIAATSAFEKVAIAAARVADSPITGPIFRAAGKIVNPHLPKSSVTRSLIDLRSGVAVGSLRSAYGETTINDLRNLARGAGKTTEIDQALASYSLDQANLLIARETRATQLSKGLGEDLVHTAPDDIIAPMVGGSQRDVLDRLTDSMVQNAKNTFTPGELDNLAGRAAHVFGGDVAGWAVKVGAMSDDLRSLLHAATYKVSDSELNAAIREVDRVAYGNAVDKLPLDQLTLMNDHTLDTTLAEELFARIKSGTTIAERTAMWNDAARVYPLIGDIGYAPGGGSQLDILLSALRRDIDRGIFPVRATEQLNDPALKPIRDMLARNTIDGKPLWRIGFKPEDSVAWGLKRDAMTGKYVAERDPSIQHVFDMPAQPRAMDTVRNVLGQTIGSHVGDVGESLDAYIRTSLDVVTGRRLVLNIQRRFEKTAVEKLGLPKQAASDLFTAARDAAGIEHTTLRGLRIEDTGPRAGLWAAMQDAIPLNFRTPSGEALTAHDVMGALLDATEGDMRVMGVLPKLTQRMRNILRRRGIDPANWAGGVTVTMYNKLRYSSPMFLIQRITDAPYFMAMQGIMPVGGGGLKATALRGLRAIEENIGRTGTARDFAFDLPEYATRSNFTDGLRTGLEARVGRTKFAEKMQAIQNAPDTYIANNMTKMLHEDLGSIVRETLEDVPKIIEGISDPALQAEMKAELAGPMAKSFAEIRNVYSQAAGHVLDDKETGLRYIQEQLASARRVTVGDTGLSTAGLIHESEWLVPHTVADIRPINPDALARELGYVDGAALRKDITGIFDRTTGARVPGAKDIPWLKERLANDLHAHPDYVKRAERYFGDSWQSYWYRVAQPVGEGGLDLPGAYGKQAQDLVARLAQDRGMDPWDFLTGVLQADLKPGETADRWVGHLANMLKAGEAPDAIKRWSELFLTTLDPSGRQTVIESAGLGQVVVPPATSIKDLTAQFGPRFIGGGFKDMPVGIKQSVVDEIGQFKADFPDVTLKNIRVNPKFHPDDLHAQAETVNYEPGVRATSIELSPRFYGKGKDVQLSWDKGVAQNELQWAVSGRPEVVSATPAGTLRHEAIHALDEHIRAIEMDARLHPALADPKQVEAVLAYRKFVNNFHSSKAANDLSQYAMTKPEEAAAELGDLAFGPEVARKAYFARLREHMDPQGLTGLPESNIEHLESVVDEYKQLVIDTGLYRPGAGTPNLADRLPQWLRERVATGLPRANPDEEAIMQQYAKFLRDELQPRLEGSTRNELAAMVKNIPTSAAVPFNRTQALIAQLVRDKLLSAKDDAWMVAEMQTKRTVMMRSLNHPVFGLYPASYMWGKVLPLTIKYLSRNPYGLTYDILRVQNAIAIQREYDPEFNAAMEEIGKSETGFALDYLTPSLPWSDMSARVSPLVRGLIQSGGPDVGRAVSGQLAMMSPERWFALFGRVGSEALDFLQGGGESQAPTIPTKQEQQLQNLQQPTPSTGPTSRVDLSVPVAAVDVRAILEQDMMGLRSLFGG